MPDAPDESAPSPTYPTRVELRPYLDTVLAELRRLIPSPVTRRAARDLLEWAADPPIEEERWHVAPYHEIVRRGRCSKSTAIRVVGYLEAISLLEVVREQAGNGDHYPNKYRLLYRADIASERMTFADWRAKREPIDHSLRRRDRLANARLRASQNVTGHKGASSHELVSGTHKDSTTYDDSGKPDVPEQGSVLPFASGTGSGEIPNRNLGGLPDPAPAGDRPRAGEGERTVTELTAQILLALLTARMCELAALSVHGEREDVARHRLAALNHEAAAIEIEKANPQPLYTYEALHPDYKRERSA